MSGTYLGMPDFPRAAARSTRDGRLRENLRHATHTIRGKRAGAVAELQDWDRLRAAGAAIKDRTLRHLDHYLERVEAAVSVVPGEREVGGGAERAERAPGRDDLAVRLENDGERCVEHDAAEVGRHRSQPHPRFPTVVG